MQQSFPRISDSQRGSEPEPALAEDFFPLHLSEVWAVWAAWPWDWAGTSRAALLQRGALSIETEVSFRMG